MEENKPNMTEIGQLFVEVLQSKVQLYDTSLAYTMVVAFKIVR